ncbi:DNA repair protein RadA [Candidatus Roizmanbacteria bacterium RIFOXYB2_FULL_38_10]|uniref:DNA repair protein RadA n=1 Tax=Candidatus Roizmanbacteria bacterium RIFOXYD1_FULL_38_12 TaxID=1802093 RepID=A0A1F7KZP3_9BACT|nr:MAG: DNA repair protein RadA [Candidatus Roizmanbacteria bacterium RIFOXYA2_FULL_38_14]OGK63360.1 MAG: DNA repair protein RadA [Candidatus Roizmanbacteria bacterium RIFOXYA1_FULL_37_12]OGK65206.1 MAG: DNA repair protein RadA [Candidatus Roizmanbacteria bacterium RIFOXYB1_FULL_40_23]OGK68759.1 MAG: DNA repair protein RadA [Candidatus Roizmanbacteria bacterium RIFOXYB2_FULL_38_10]OGK69611.1 MAG: DNA repair protein RadA [Candidatus Roizmanbacteria bacterium RIFOXYC1_FULL_38_14]OGK72762.1 MAG: 
MAFYICSNCEYGAASWIGKCPNCGEWNTMTQKQEQPSSKNEDIETITLTSLSKIKTSKKERKKTGMFEFDRVLGSGFVPGEVVLLTGEPGVGKSTLLLQSLSKLQTIYISGEESAEQIRDRAERLDSRLDAFDFSNDLQVEGIVNYIENAREKPEILVIDSIQTVYSKDIESAPGSINQLKESASKLISMAKKNKIAVILIGHITKEGDVAGPKTLEHLVDCVLNFEGEQVSSFRILRASKNRFGSTDEIGIFEMKEGGLYEVTNPLVFLDDVNELVPGKSIVGVNEGKRQLFYEIQTLAVPTVLSIPRRVVKGVDYNKVQLLLAVIKKHLNLQLDRFDIYVNVIGGVKITSTLADLGIISSLYSSLKNISISKKTVFIGEVGLLGEVRRGFAEDKIISESRRLGFKNIYSSKNIQSIKKIKDIIAL